MVVLFALSSVTQTYVTFTLSGGPVHARALILKPAVRLSLLAALGACTIMAASLPGAKSQGSLGYWEMMSERYFMKITFWVMIGNNKIH